LSIALADAGSFRLSDLGGSGVLGSGDREDVITFFFERIEFSERTPFVIIRLHHCKLPAIVSAGPKRP
jgi:hypothetical protein